MAELKPFFCYYGGKWRVAKKYPKPRHSKIIEPFAGAAGYSLRHYKSDILLIEKNPKIAALWDWLIKVESKEVLSIPLDVNHVDELEQEQWKLLVGFWFNKGTVGPNLTPSKWMRSKLRPKSFWGSEIRNRIAEQVNYIRHWKVICGDCFDHPNEIATWFIDPPYSGNPGKLYKHKIDCYDSLKDWVLQRNGQVIACERQGADWLPFTDFHEIKTTPGLKGKSTSKEVIFNN